MHHRNLQMTALIQWCEIPAGNCLFSRIATVKYNGKNYVLIKPTEGILCHSSIKFVGCELVTQPDQESVDMFITDVIAIANGTLKKTSVQPDWNQNDEAAHDFVKNRTHWTENGIIHQLDEKYIPDTIARKSDIVNNSCILTDEITGIQYKLTVSNGTLTMKEVNS